VLAAAPVVLELVVADVSLAVCPADGVLAAGALAAGVLGDADIEPPLVFWSVVWATAIDPITSAAVAPARARGFSMVFLH
jgi:hypothetical protein